MHHSPFAEFYDNGVFNLEWRSWWLTFLAVADRRGLNPDKRNPKAYREYFDDGDSPAQAVNSELRGTLRKEG